MVSHPAVAEAAVVGRPDEIKGQGIVAFVVLRSGHAPSDKLKEQIRKHVSDSIGPIAKPDEIRFAEMLPKTRSGKIMRRLLKQVAGGHSLTGDTSTLEDLSVLTKLSKREE
jgi:acetyl-CoA synthetase